MSPILVTGGAGYIGSHVCKSLREKGYLPVTYDNLSIGHPWAVKWGPLIQGDLHDKVTLEKAFREWNLAGVIHLAALSNVRESQKHPLLYYQNNIAGTLSLLEMVLKFEIRKFVFSSTCAVYGMPNQIPISEDHEKVPINVYGETKLTIEKTLANLPLDVAVLRYFNAAGADPEGDIGESHNPETHLIPSLIQSILNKKIDFTLYGNDHQTPDKTPIRDYIHVTDLARAHVLALEYLEHKKKNLTLNLGTGVGCSVMEVIETLESQFSCKIPVKIGLKIPEDPPVLLAKSDQAFHILNWKPHLSDLPTILDTAWKWLSR